MKEKTILLVEDDFLNRRFTKKILLENGYNIIETKNAKEALEVVQKETVDLGILDINLGEDQQDGISLGQQIKDNYSIPFIYLTAYESSEIITRAVTTLPYSYLTKPIKNADLIASVEIAIRQSAKQEKQPAILVKDGKYNKELLINEIDYIESEGNYLLFHANSKVYKCRSTIKQIMEILPKTIFIQTHRAFVVNKNRIDKFTVKSLIIKNNSIPVSKNYTGNITWQENQ